MKALRQVCPFCGGIMTPIYNGNLKKTIVYGWECGRMACQFNPHYPGDNALEHRNMKKILKMQSRIAELESLLAKDSQKA